MPAAKIHTIATLAAELDALLPDLTTEAAPTLARTLVRNVARDHVGCICPASVITTADRRRILDFAKRNYPIRSTT